MLTLQPLEGCIVGGVTGSVLTIAERYVRLSPAYAAAATARGRGWPVVGDGTGAHLDVANDPRRVADLLG